MAKTRTVRARSRYWATVRAIARRSGADIRTARSAWRTLRDRYGETLSSRTVREHPRITDRAVADVEPPEPPTPPTDYADLDDWIDDYDAGAFDDDDRDEAVGGLDYPKKGRGK